MSGNPPYFIVFILVVILFASIAWITMSKIEVPGDLSIETKLKITSEPSFLVATLAFTNISNKVVFLENYNFVIHGELGSDTFKITSSDGVLIPYVGFLPKKPSSALQPSKPTLVFPDNFFRLEPGATYETSVQLRLYYKFLPGLHDYTLQYQGLHAYESSPQLFRHASDTVKFSFEKVQTIQASPIGYVPEGIKEELPKHGIYLFSNDSGGSIFFIDLDSRVLKYQDKTIKLSSQDAEYFESFLDSGLRETPDFSAPIPARPTMSELIFSKYGMYQVYILDGLFPGYPSDVQEFYRRIKDLIPPST